MCSKNGEAKQQRHIENKEQMSVAPQVMTSTQRMEHIFKEKSEATQSSLIIKDETGRGQFSGNNSQITFDQFQSGAFN